MLGPLLCLIYINDLYHVCSNCTPILFADDTNLFINGADIDHMQSILNNDLAHISQCLIVNKFSLNVTKTHHMVFTKKRVARNVITIKINGKAISEVNKTKFLGVIMSNKINWKDHIKHIAGKSVTGCRNDDKGEAIFTKIGTADTLLCIHLPLLHLLQSYLGSTYVSN